MRIIGLAIAIVLVLQASAQPLSPAFQVVPLGTRGGLDESNLSAYLLAPIQSDTYVCLDAGTLYAGIEKAISNHVFNKPATAVLRGNIKGYLISHAHLDHVAGLIINAPADTNKNIYGTVNTLNTIQNHYFSWETWANFGDKGEKPALKKYHLVSISDTAETIMEGTGMYAKAFTLSHSSPYQSTAFLLRKDSAYILYLGDTGADTIEHSNRLQLLWQVIAPLVQQRRLKGIFIEVSYPNGQPDYQLYGHLTPRLLLQEMEVLAMYAGKASMYHFPIIITHAKPEGNNEQRIKVQLQQANTLQLHLVFPEQGVRILL